MSIGLMAEPKHPKKRPGPKPNPAKTRNAAIMVRSTDEWKEWVEELAAFKRMTASDLIDHALVAFAREAGFTKMPPRR